MEYFKKYFNDIDDWLPEEVKVCCPFHDDTSPSASINTNKGLFHCWVCDIGYNEPQFMAKLNNISQSDANKLVKKVLTNDWEIDKGTLWADQEYLEKVLSLGLSKELVNDYHLGMHLLNQKPFLTIPIFYNKVAVDLRYYNIFKHEGFPKLLGQEGSSTGWLFPYDDMLETKPNTKVYIFEGEKDTLLARELGINAYTLTGGAGASPNSYIINSFRDKDVIICYDNDDAGREGSYKLYKNIKELVNSVKYINIGEVVKEEKEDFYDYITKYGGDIIDFYSLDFHEFKDEEEKDDKITIKQALEKNLIKKELKSTITVTSEFVDPYSVPTIVDFEKGDETNNDDMYKGEIRTWFLETSNLDQMLELIEVSADKQKVKNKLKSFAGISSSEDNVFVTQKDLNTVYKASITDKDVDGSSVSLDLYSFRKLEVGGQYIIKYKIYPHPTKNQKLIAVAFDITEVHDNKNYKINKDLLSLFRIEGTIQERLDYLYANAKHYIAQHLAFDTWFMSDLVFNSILDFRYGEIMKGALDVFFLGDTQVGKSETTSHLVSLYNFGHFLSLKTSTTVGLIGGSNKVDGSWCNTIGSIPRQHKRLAVLEEFSGARKDFIKTMTDIRSSNLLRLSRASGELIVPCKLRMITISNPINDENGGARSLDTFPNGIMPLMELISSAEDIARYDGFLLIPKIEHRFNPFKQKLVGQPIQKDAYVHKINWVSTRMPDNVLFDDDVESYIWEKAEQLNELFECNFPLFGTTTSKKLAKFCVALASLLVNVDESYENIVVTNEIVDYMFNYLIKIYDNEVFKLRDYANEYKAYSKYTQEDIKELEQIYSRNATMVEFLYNSSRATRSNLMSVSGLDASKFSVIFNKMIGDKYIRLSMDNVFPTDKFRKVYRMINKDLKVNAESMINDSSQIVSFVNDLGGGA